MPFAATKQKDDEDGILLAADAKGNDEYVCPECGETLVYRKSYIRGKDADGMSEHRVAEHFMHKTDADESCAESDQHRRLKSIATSEVKQLLDDVVQEAYTEDHPEKDTLTVESVSDSENNERQPDAVVKLREDRTEHEALGKGVLIEVQVENKNKDTEATEEDYLRNGWSVLWLEPEDFTDANELCWGRVADLRDKKGACVPVFPKAMRWNEEESEGPLLMYSGEQPPSQDTDRHLDVYYPESVDIGMDAFSWSMEDQYVRLPPEAAFRIVRAEPTRWDCLFSGGRPKTPPQINREIPYAELADEIGEYVPGDTDTEATIELTKFVNTTNDGHAKPFADWVKKEIKTAHKKGADERTRRQRIKDKVERRKYKDILSGKGERDRSTKKPSLKDLEEVRKDTTLMIVCECGMAVGSFNTFLLHAHTHRIQDEEEAALKARIQDRHRNVREA